MPLRQEPDGLLVLDLGDEPQFSADIQELNDRMAAYGPGNLVVNLGSVTLLNSSQLAALVHIRSQLMAGDKRMVLCSLPTRLQTTLKTSGLERAFVCAPDLKSARQSFQVNA
jgi:anti-anti-sigma factor